MYFKVDKERERDCCQKENGNHGAEAAKCVVGCKTFSPRRYWNLGPHRPLANILPLCHQHFPILVMSEMSLALGLRWRAEGRIDFAFNHRLLRFFFLQKYKIHDCSDNLFDKESQNSDAELL